MGERKSMELENNKDYKKNLYGALALFALILCVFFIVKIFSEIRSYKMIGGDFGNTIVVSGHGEVEAVPDIANVSFTISKEAKTVKEAQDAVAEIENKALEFLKENKVADKDIKATDASFYPKYEYRYNAPSISCVGYGCPPNPGKNVITGYEASETITVKVRDTDAVGTIIQGLGALGVSNLNGPNFSIDDEDVLKAQARKLAIVEAREKAKVLAKDLGVKLGRISSFNESGDYYPMYQESMMYKDADMAVSSVPAQLPVGQNTIASNVTIVFEIR